MQANLGNYTPQISFGNLLLGGRTTYGSASSPNTLYFAGLDEFDIYDRALSATEIQAIYNEKTIGANAATTANAQRDVSQGSWTRLYFKLKNGGGRGSCSIAAKY